jgi:hypothetical protein
MIEKYNNNSVAIFSSQNRVTGFEIHNGIEKKQFGLDGVAEGSIIAVQEYSPNEAAVAIIHNGKTTTVLLYSISTAKKDKEQSVDFPIDGFVKLGDNWVVICTTEEEANSSIKVQGVFRDGDNKV